MFCFLALILDRAPPGGDREGVCIDQNLLLLRLPRCGLCSKKKVVFKPAWSFINSEESEFLLNICMDVSHYVIQSLFLWLPFLHTGLKQAKQLADTQNLCYFTCPLRNAQISYSPGKNWPFFFKIAKKFTDYHLTYNFLDSVGRYLVNGCIAFNRMNYFFSRRHKLKHTFKKQQSFSNCIAYHLTLTRLTWLTRPTKVQTILINNIQEQLASLLLSKKKIPSKYTKPKFSPSWMKTLSWSGFLQLKKN